MFQLEFGDDRLLLPNADALYLALLPDYLAFYRIKNSYPF